MRFFKYHGTGNDFVIVKATGGALPLHAEEIVDLCRRNTGVGADGVIFSCPSATGADAAMRLFNADGSEAEMSGNGIRCLAKYLYEREGMRGEALLIDTGGGVRELRIRGDGERAEEIEVDMGLPEFSSRALPEYGDPSHPGMATIALEGGEEFAVFCLSLGNPHCVLFVDDVDSARVHDLGPLLECHPSFPMRTNVEFAAMSDPGRMRLRVWERGVGETSSCGTGASAAFAASVQSGRGESPMRVELPGGVLTVRRDEHGHIILAGPTVEVFEGELNPRWRG